MVIEWVVVGMLILIGLVFLKFEHHTRKIKVVAIILIGFLIYFSVMGIFSSDNIDITSPRGIINGVYIYFGWLGQTLGGLWDIGTDTAVLVGDVVKVNNTQEYK